MQTSRPKAYQFDNFILDVGNRELLRDSEAVPLPAKAFDMLVTLVEGGGRLISKDDLFRRVWPDQIVEESNLTVQVSAIRKALGDRTNSPQYLVTVPGHGYKFIGKVTNLNVAAEETVIEQHSVSRVTIETGDAIDKLVLTNPDQIKERYESLTPALSKQNTLGLRPVLSHRWLLIGTGAVVLLAVVVVFYRQVRSNAAVFPFERIAFKRLTNSRTVRDAVLSPDGKLFAYEYTASEGWQRGLWLGHVDGGESIQLIPDAAASYSSMSFSRDSGSLYFVAINRDNPSGALFRVPVFGGVPEKLRAGINARVSFSPDMKSFVYAKDDAKQNSSSLIIENTTSGPPTVLATRATALAFSPGPAWSPDGAKIAVCAINQAGSASGRELFLVSVADSQITQLTKHNFGSIRSLTWLKDGSGLVVVAKEDPASNQQLWYVSVADGAVRSINPDSYDYGGALNISDDGNSLLALQTQTLANIWVGPADHLDQAKRITYGSIGRREGLYGLDWTPDDHIAFAAFEDRNEML
ncbi:MAG TPA: winged helix-turn-helix domain-containing protein [Pyrinomonadaceae bacterium]|nr:winged helix-turn-helix domain-containing protein [Pyrinomonadaceae bacterium]